MIKEFKERKQKEEERLNELSKQLDKVKETQQVVKELIGRCNKLEEKSIVYEKRLEGVEKGLTGTEKKLEGHDTSRVLGVIIIVIIVFVVILLYNNEYDKMQKEIHELQKEVHVLQETVDSLPVNTCAQNNLNAIEIFVNAVFPMKEKEMYDKNGNTFYYDPDCKYAISNPIFCDWREIGGEDSKGNAVKIYRLTNGDFAYIPSNFNVDISRLN